MEENEIDVEALRAEVAELRARAAEQSERIARYEGAGSGDILAALERMEQRLAPPPDKREQKILRIIERRGCTREEAEALNAVTDRFWANKKRRENNWNNVM